MLHLSKGRVTCGGLSEMVPYGVEVTRHPGTQVEKRTGSRCSRNRHVARASQPASTRVNTELHRGARLHQRTHPRAAHILFIRFRRDSTHRYISFRLSSRKYTVSNFAAMAQDTGLFSVRRPREVNPLIASHMHKSRFRWTCVPS